MLTLLTLLVASQIEVEERFIAIVESARTAEVAALKSEAEQKRSKLTLAKRGTVNRALRETAWKENRPPMFHTVEAKRAAIEQLTKEIADAESRAKLLDTKAVDPRMPLDLEKLAAGDMGEINALGFVLQVIGAKDLLVRFEWSDGPATILPRGGVIAAPTKDTLMWLELPTNKGIVDSEQRPFGGLFEVVGTKKYQSSAGVKTVWHLRQIVLKK